MNQATKTAFPTDTALAIGYVKWQELFETYDPEKGYVAGTIFPELNKPFYGRRARYGMQGCR